MSHVSRRLVAIVMMLALVVSFGASGRNAQAQGTSKTGAPGTWQSSINLQNTSSTAADVSITFYDANGAVAQTYPASGSTSIPANGALSIFVPNDVSALAGGQYSAVVNSSSPIKATVNTASTNSASAPWTAFGYEGADSSQAGATLYFPGLYKNYFNFFSEMVIQNADASRTATLTAKFYDRNGAQVGGDVALGTVAPNSSKTFTTASLGTLPSGDAAGLFGAVVTSNDSIPLVGVANIWRSTPTAGTASYNAFVGGSSNLFAPALYKNYYGFASALTIQNVGSGTAAGTITYSNGTTVPFSLAPFASQEFYQPNNAALPSGDTAGVFSAKVTTTSGSVVGLVSLSNPAGGAGDFASYNVPGAASPNVNITNVLSDYYGYFSAVTVQNTGSQATNITITYATGQSRTYNNVPANGTVNIIHLNNAGDVLANSTSTSAVVSSSNGQPLVAVAQHNTAAGVQGYNPSKLPSDFLLATTGSPK